MISNFNQTSTCQTVQKKLKYFKENLEKKGENSETIESKLSRIQIFLLLKEGINEQDFLDFCNNVQNDVKNSTAKEISLTKREIESNHHPKSHRRRTTDRGHRKSRNTRGTEASKISSDTRDHYSLTNGKDLSPPIVMGPLTKDQMMASESQEPTKSDAKSDPNRHKPKRNKSRKPTSHSESPSKKKSSKSHGSVSNNHRESHKKSKRKHKKHRSHSKSSQSQESATSTPSRSRDHHKQSRSQSRSRTRSGSIRRRTGSPSHLDRRRITRYATTSAHNRYHCR